MSYGTCASAIGTWRRRASIIVTGKSAFGSLAFFLHVVAHHIHGFRQTLHRKPVHRLYLDRFVIFCLTIPSQFWVGSRFYTNVFKAIEYGNGLRDVLVILGAPAAYFYSLFARLALLTTRQNGRGLSAPFKSRWIFICARL